VIDYAKHISDYFIELRAKGSAISSADQAALLAWEAEGVPIDVVISGIDHAFRARREPPMSLCECKRYINRAMQQWLGEAAETISFPIPVVNSDSAVDVPTDAATLEMPRFSQASNAPLTPGARIAVDLSVQRLMSSLVAYAQSVDDNRVRRALLALHDELRGADEAWSGALLLDAAETAFLDHMLNELRPSDRVDIAEAVSRAMSAEQSAPAQHAYRRRVHLRAAIHALVNVPRIDRDVLSLE